MIVLGIILIFFGFWLVGWWILMVLQPSIYAAVVGRPVPVGFLFLGVMFISGGVWCAIS